MKTTKTLCVSLLLLVSGLLLPMSALADNVVVADANGNELYNQFTENYDNWHWVKTSTFQTPIDKYKPQTVKVYPQYKLFGFFPLKGEPAEITIPKPLTLSTNRWSFTMFLPAPESISNRPPTASWQTIRISPASKKPTATSPRSSRPQGSSRAAWTSGPVTTTRSYRCCPWAAKA